VAGRVGFEGPHLFLVRLVEADMDEPGVHGDQPGGLQNASGFRYFACGEPTERMVRMTLDLVDELVSIGGAEARGGGH